jgi:hypothetical protein
MSLRVGNVGADAGRHSYWRIVVAQYDFRIFRVEAGFQKPGPAQIEVGMEKQPYQFCVEGSEYLPPVRRARGPVLVNNIHEIGMMSGPVDAMVADRITHGTHDTRVTRDPAQDGGYKRF